MLRHRFSPPSFVDTKKNKTTGKIESSNPSIEYIFLKKGLMLSKFTARRIKRRYYHNSMQPEKIKDDSSTFSASIDECNAYISLINSYQEYAKEEQLKLSSSEDAMTKLFHTSIIVYKNKVFVDTYDQLLLEALKKKTQVLGYQFVNVRKENMTYEQYVRKESENI